MRYVIIGNSTAATFAVEGIRSCDGEGSITVLSCEVRPAYGRPLISYYLCGRVDEAQLDLRPPAFYEKNKVQLLLGVWAEKIDAAGQEVLLSDGRRIGYDRLLVATGSRPLVPPIPGLEAVEQKFTFMTMEDALGLERAVTPQTRVLTLGAGLIGLKCVEGLLHRAGEVTVVDMQTRILPSILDGEGAALVQRELEREGVRFVLGDSVARFEGNTAVLGGGGKIAFDVLVVAVGVRPNTELVREAGGEVRRGIVVDERQETTLPHIYAAGDNCESYDVCSKTGRILALLPNAAFQGEIAGKAMAGGKAVYLGGAPFNALGLFGVHIATAGVYEGESYTERGEGTYKRLFYRDNVLKGYILIGCIERAGIYTALVRDRTPLDAVDFERLKRAPQLMAFTGSVRREKLGVRREE